MSEIITSRDIDIVTAEIKTIQRQAQKMMLLSAIEIGRRLAEAKTMLNHGEWGKWLAESVDYSQSTADNLLRLYKEYGDSDQESLFENFGNSETFKKLSYTQALALLAVPAVERERFAEENHVADMSTRELQQAIRERDEAQKAQEEAEDRAREAEELAEQQEAKDKKEIERLKEAAALDKTVLNAMKNRAEVAEAQQKKAEEKNRAAQQSVDSLKKQLAEAKDETEKARAEIPAGTMERLQKEAAEAAAKEAEKQLKKKLDAAETAATKAMAEKEKAEASAKEAREKLEAAQKAVKMAAPEIAVFQSMFEALQEGINRINGYRLRTAQSNPDAAHSMAKALNALYTKALEGLK